jgi:ATP-dependent DNA helicase RecG
MTEKQIRQLLKEGEGLNVEFKKAENSLPDNLFETICAFLNTDGGYILLGVNDNGKITGVKPKMVKQLKKELASLSNNPQKLDLPYLLFPKKFEVDGKIIIAIQVPLSSQLHKTGGHIYLRS